MAGSQVNAPKLRGGVSLSVHAGGLKRIGAGVRGTRVCRSPRKPGVLKRFPCTSDRPAIIVGPAAGSSASLGLAGISPGEPGPLPCVPIAISPTINSCFPVI